MRFENNFFKGGFLTSFYTEILKHNNLRQYRCNYIINCEELCLMVLSFSGSISQHMSFQITSLSTASK